MAINELENDTYVKRWLNGLAPRTKRNYLKEFPLWCSFVKMSPTEQIEKRLQDLTSTDLTKRTFFENKFRAYKEMLEGTGRFNALSVQTMLRTVASFFSRNDLNLSLKKGDWKSTLKTEVIHKFKLALDDVKAMYTHASLRDKCLLLVLAQSGFSEVDVSELKIEDIKGLYEMPQTEHYFIEKPREKTGEIQATCLSYEFLHDLRALLAESGNPIEGYIFTSQTKDKGSQIETRRINEAMKNLAKKTFDKEKAKQFKTKALRSFYNSALLRGGIKGEIKDVMMGHKRLGARGHYAYDEFTIKEAYKSAFENLSINGIQSREDLAELRNRAEAQSRELKAMRSILISLISREKLEELIKQNLEKPELKTVKVSFETSASRKKLSDKELWELYLKTL
jgi:integrase